MNFITFATQFTNIFPASNSTAGGQLLTEWNLKSRESVMTDPQISYSVGPSFVHGEKDFEVQLWTNERGGLRSNSTLKIAEGRGVINGHYVETLAPMYVDIEEANAKLQAQSRPLLKGPLAVGIRTFFATESTVAGTILVESHEESDPEGNNAKEMFLGIQMVVLPEEELITPLDSPGDQSKVTADIKLAKFTFVNNAIQNLQNLYTSKLQYISSDRITDLSNVVSSKYVTKIGLNSKKLYAFAGKGVDPETGADTWEDVTDSMFIWDADPGRNKTKVKPVEREAYFAYIDNQTEPDPYNEERTITYDGTYLILPHKQVEGMTTDDGEPEYYSTRKLKIPSADYTNNTSGVVTREYTAQIKEIARQVSLYRTSLNGKQIYYMPIRTVSTTLPPVNQAWDYGDYILVGNDEYYVGGAGDDTSAPSTMYVVLPGLISSNIYNPDPGVKFITKVDGNINNSADFPTNIKGAQLGFQDWYYSAGQHEPAEDPGTIEDPNQYWPTLYSIYDEIRGIPCNSNETIWYDYFKIRYYKEEPDPENPISPYTDYYYGVYRTGRKEWSDAVLVTGTMPFATEVQVGGFLNIDETELDQGYVYIDSTGHLKLLDYELLRSGTLAYQLGSDITIPTNEDFNELQNYLDEYVNDRVAFPPNRFYNKNYPNYPKAINVSITLPKYDGEGLRQLEISGIDSRFNTPVCIHIYGEAESNVALNIVDCEKVIIDPTIAGNPIINVFRSNLYYDPTVMQYIRNCYRDNITQWGNAFTGFRDLKLWYEQFDPTDPKLVVDNMTVSELDSPIIANTIDYWKELGSAINDNYYMVALRAITFSGSGDIVGIKVLVANNSTDNIDPGEKIVVGQITIPQGENLVYPVTCMTRNLKVTGTFTNAYSSEDLWYVTDTSFTIKTSVYPDTAGSLAKGIAAFHSKTSLVTSTISQTSIDPWEPDSYNLFEGGAVS